MKVGQLIDQPPFNEGVILPHGMTRYRNNTGHPLRMHTPLSDVAPPPDTDTHPPAGDATPPGEHGNPTSEG